MKSFTSTIFLILQCYGAHQASYPMDTRGAGGKAAGEWSWPLTSI
jgi:hypothetical protein